MTHPKLIVYGGGNMGGALVRGAIAGGVLAPAQVLVVEPDVARRAALAALGVEVVSAAGGLDGAWHARATSLLAIKPQMFEGLCRELAGRAVSRVISVMAGVSMAKLQEGLGCPRIVRAMPNLPAVIGEGCTAMAVGPGAMAEDGAFAERLFAMVGTVVNVDEGLLDAFTGVAGSGPAYVFYLAEAMREAAIGLGLEPAIADAAVRQTIKGAAAMLCGSEDSPETLRARVTSPGGTTAAAIEVLNQEHVKESIGRAITAARERGSALGRSGS